MDTRIALREPEKEFVGIGPYQGFKFAQNLVWSRAFCYKVDVGGQIYWHVFKKWGNPRFGVFSYPGPEAFGRWAWCYRSFDQAMEKFNSL